MNSEKKKQESDFGHNENEWGLKDESEENEWEFKDGSEEIEWDMHYHDRNKKWRIKDEEEKT